MSAAVRSRCPFFSLLAIEGGEIPLKGILQGGATAFTLSAAQGDVRLGVDVHGLLKSDADLGDCLGRHLSCTRHKMGMRTRASLSLRFNFQS